jgi:hypothetical protein
MIPVVSSFTLQNPTSSAGPMTVPRISRVLPSDPLCVTSTRSNYLNFSGIGKALFNGLFSGSFHILEQLSQRRQQDMPNYRPPPSNVPPQYLSIR